MVRQVIDIIKTKNKKDQKGEGFFAALKPKSKKEKTAFESKKEKSDFAKKTPVKKKKKTFSSLLGSSLFLLYFIGGIVVIGGIVFLLMTFNAKMDLLVKPVLTPVSIEQDIQISVAQKEVDFINKILPGQLIQATTEKEDTFTASGENLMASATGTLFVYNNINPPTPLTLREGTRFLSSKEGKIFKTLNKIVLPPALLTGGKITPSITEVVVQAQEAGEDYNIEPAKFSVPGLRGTVLYYNVWAESRQKMQGGGLAHIEKITAQDIENAQNTLTKGAQEEIFNKLKSQTDPSFLLDQEGIGMEQKSFDCSPGINTASSTFKCRLSTTGTALIYKEQDLQQMVENILQYSLSPNQKIYTESLRTIVQPKNKTTNSGILLLRVRVTGQSYSAVDTDTLVNNSVNRSKTDILNTITQQYAGQIEKANIRLKPFWVKTAPKNPEKIRVQIVFSNP